jgi:hypothetical protein
MCTEQRDKGDEGSCEAHCNLKFRGLSWFSGTWLNWGRKTGEGRLFMREDTHEKEI